MRLTVVPHAPLDLHAFVTHLPGPLGHLATPPELAGLLDPGAEAPLAADPSVRGAVRDLLRHGGFKPAGRSKPASEYLLRAAAQGPLRSINLAVDACNAVSLHSGLPISVVDADLLRPPARIAVPEGRTTYVFNPSGQEIDVGGLVVLCDALGACAGPVKDSQRTKTNEATICTLSLIWSSVHLPGRGAAATAWYRALLERAGATTLGVELAGVDEPVGE